MNNIKMVTFGAIFAFFINTYSGDGIGSDHGKNAGLAAAKIVCETLDNNKELISGTTTETARVLGSDAAEKLGSDAAEKFGGAVKTVGMYASAAYVVVQAIKLGSDGYKYYYPSEEKKASEAKAAQEYQLLAAKREFRECLIKNAKTERRKSTGLPNVCKDRACNLAMAGGEADLESITKTFKQHYKQDNEL